MVFVRSPACPLGACLVASTGVLASCRHDDKRDTSTKSPDPRGDDVEMGADPATAAASGEALAGVVRAGEFTSSFERPERYDVISDVPARDELNIHARTKGERTLYREQLARAAPCRQQGLLP